MQKTKDPAIKLFGKTIPLPADGELKAVSRENSIVVSESEEMDCDHTTRTTCSQEEKKQSIARSEAKELGKHIVAVKIIEAKHEDGGDESDNPKTPTIDQEMTTFKTSKTSGEAQSDTTKSQEKPLKKPDKILPCPRCSSMETKFCYYNNYNVNQPRHFCKGCQRYWTAGGTTRNVPVGAGRRKNKNSAINYHMTISEALQAAQIDDPIGAHHAAFENKGSAVLNFGSDASLFESMASGLNLAEKTMWNGTPNVFRRTKKQTPVSYRVGESGDDHTSGSYITDLNSMEGRLRNYAQESLLPNVHDFPSQIPCLPGVPWPCPCPTVPPPKNFCHPEFGFSLHPASYWGCAIPDTWNVPWLCSSPPTNQKAPISTPNSPTLGKHSRDGDKLKIDNPEEPEEEEPRKHKCTSDHSIWVPKTLRIDDPDEAAKSSIWETLGINKNDTFSGKGLMKAFQTRSGEKNHVDKTSSALWANPAALSRSCNFQESS